MRMPKKAIIMIICIVLTILVAVAIAVWMISARRTLAEDESESIYTENQGSEQGCEEEINYVDYVDEGLGYSFRYPGDWVISDIEKDPPESNDEIGIKSVLITNSEETFSFGFSSTYLTGYDNPVGCEQLMDCGAYVGKLYNEYDPEVFERFIELDGQKLYISKTGVIDYVSSGEGFIMRSGLLSSSYGGGLTQIVEGKMTEQLSIYGHGSDVEEFDIFFNFSDQDALSNWPEYKEIFRTFAASIQPVQR